MLSELIKQPLIDITFQIAFEINNNDAKPNITVETPMTVLIDTILLPP